MRNRDGIIQQGAGRGLSFNARGSTAGMLLGTTEPELQMALETVLVEGGCFYDVGANVGFFSVIAARLVGAKGKVVAFDPLPSNIDAILHNANLNDFKQIETREIALGAEDGTAEFIVSSDPNWGRLASVGTPDAIIGRKQVSVRTIDRLVSGGDQPPAVMKIDVEGAEVEVLRGARATIVAYRPIIFIDLHGTNEAVKRFFDSLDYELAVFGSPKTITEVGWDAQVVALPSGVDSSRLSSIIAQKAG